MGGMQVANGRVQKAGCCSCCDCCTGIKNCVKRRVCSKEEMKMLQAADALWHVVNVDNKRTLDASASMLIMKVLEGDERWAMLTQWTHPWGNKRETIEKFREGLEWATSASSPCGKNITEEEFRDAFLGAVRRHAHQTAEAVLKDVVAEYRRLGRHVG